MTVKNASDVESQSKWRELVRDWLHAHERSQAWLARKAQVHPMHLSNCLLGKSQVGILVLSRLEDAMDMKPGTLLIAARHTTMEPRDDKG